jgi:DNA-binding transcriptional LysR family regulator
MRNPQPHPALTTRSLRTERLIAVVPSDHPAARGGQVALRDLRESAFVTHPSGTRSVMHGTVLAACRQAGFVPVEIIEARETATLVAFVAAGIGVALLPGPVRSLALDGVAYLPLSDVDQQTELVLAMRSDEPSSATHRVAELVANVAQATSAVTCGRRG